ncbi:Pnap_2097 family protein [Methylobacterium durans]|uniref:Pnap_2097 family protein n=1 Tax=Methylobacterium durans TaxID=2202825 RepID=UPI002AFFA5F7|nr:Pnap_2097 family protein [Methylobacterium durans]MEA1834782.1 Pnap_2097 family protein [Methylobacterium durans]
MGLHMRLPGGEGSPLSETSRYTLGMPHLCPNGLSENWLWKELGHRHWGLIAEIFGRGAAGFDPSGEQPTYAAFRRIALHGGDLGSVRENDTIDVRSTLTHLSETRVTSRHVVGHLNRLVADVGMTSVFVRRQTEGRNSSIARVRLEHRDRLALPATGGASQLRDAGDVFRADDSCDDEREVGALAIEPCPQLDFNGAGLLYFSSFIAAVDRAEWHLLGKGKRLYATRERRVVFHANIEVGDTLTVRILLKRDGVVRRHRALVCASADGKPLAEIETHRVT